MSQKLASMTGLIPNLCMEPTHRSIGRLLFGSVRLFAVSLAIALIGGEAHANEARHCIEIEQVNDNGREMTALKNTCPDKVYVRWCYQGADKGACGGERFYNRSRTIDGHDFHTSKYGLPTGPAIHFAACFGKFPMVFKGAENLGAYACKPVVQCEGNGKSVVFSRVKTGGNTKVAIYKATRGDTTHTFKLDIDDMNDIPPHVLENAIKLRACIGPAGMGDMEKVRKAVMRYLKTKMKFDEDVCANVKPQPTHCTQNRSLGRRG